MPWQYAMKQSPDTVWRHSQAFINKHDYARLHSYEFHSHPVARNRTAPGTWYRLQVVKQVGWLHVACL